MTSTSLSQLQARDAAAAREQDSINGLSLVGEIREAIYAAIDRELGRYPQYADHGRDYLLGFITKLIRTKRGVAFRTGDVVLYREATDEDRKYGCGFPTAYSVRNGIDTAVPTDSIEPLAVSNTYRHPLGLVSLGG